MLVLARNVGQRIHIGHDIWVEVLEVRGHSVRLGIEAPRQVDVHREEIYQRIQQGREPAVQALSQTVPWECRA